MMRNAKGPAHQQRVWMGGLLEQEVLRKVRLLQNHKKSLSQQKMQALSQVLAQAMLDTVLGISCHSWKRKGNGIRASAVACRNISLFWSNCLRRHGLSTRPRRSIPTGCASMTLASSSLTCSGACSLPP